MKYNYYTQKEINKAANDYTDQHQDFLNEHPECQVIVTQAWENNNRKSDDFIIAFSLDMISDQGNVKGGLTDSFGIRKYIGLSLKRIQKLKTFLSEKGIEYPITIWVVPCEMEYGSSITLRSFEDFLKLLSFKDQKSLEKILIDYQYKESKIIDATLTHELMAKMKVYKCKNPEKLPISFYIHNSKAIEMYVTEEKII